LDVAATDVLLDKVVGETVTFPEGGVVFIKGDRGDAAYMVRTGKVEIRQSGRVVEAMARGEIFGEMALIDSEPRSASAVAVGATELAVIDKDAFHKLIRDDPDFAISVMQLMSRRLRATLAAERATEERVAVPVAPLPRTG
jgi:CRP/FNR family transcriptional regulator, cyclic AMP receptor protein